MFAIIRTSPRGLTTLDLKIKVGSVVNLSALLGPYRVSLLFIDPMCKSTDYGPAYDAGTKNVIDTPIPGGICQTSCPISRVDAAEV